MSSTLLSIVAILASLVGIVSGVLAIRHHLSPDKRGKIDNPPTQSENGGRYLTVIGNVIARKRNRIYWLAIQPSDCRGAGSWWPQGQQLLLESDGGWLLHQAKLGRDGPEGDADIGKSFTIALVEIPVRSTAQRDFQKMTGDEGLRLSPNCKILDSVEVKRVRY